MECLGTAITYLAKHRAVGIALCAGSDWQASAYCLAGKQEPHFGAEWDALALPKHLVAGCVPVTFGTIHNQHVPVTIGTCQ